MSAEPAAAHIAASKLKNVGVEPIDLDHARILDIANRLYAAVQEHRVHDVLGPLLDELTEAYDEHFRREEEYFERARHPRMVDHKADHDALRRRLAEIKSRFDASPSASISLRALGLLRDYLRKHMAEFDAVDHS